MRKGKSTILDNNIGVQAYMLKVILYGIGEGSEYVRKQMLGSTEIVAYSDSSAEIELYRGIQFIRLDSIWKIEFDYIIVTIIDREEAWKISKEIEHKCMINKDKIIPYFCCCNTELYVHKLAIFKKNVDTIIIGNSHAQRGLLECAFPNTVINLSSPGIDLFQIYETLKLCVSNFSKLSRFIVDLYDYTYLNIDASMLDWAKSVYLEGGAAFAQYKKESIDEQLYDCR